MSEAIQVSQPAGSIGIYDVGDVYDAIYNGRGKDYRAESAVVAKHIRSRFPAAASLLDVGCGTGGHPAHFAEEFGEVRGIDLSDGMLDVARPGRDVQQFSDTHVMALYSRAQYEAAFTAAGFTVEYVTGEYPGNGLFVGVKQKGE